MPQSTPILLASPAHVCSPWTAPTLGRPIPKFEQMTRGPKSKKYKAASAREVVRREGRCEGSLHALCSLHAPCSSIPPVATYISGIFTLTFPRSLNTTPLLLKWPHLLGEEPLHGITLHTPIDRLRVMPSPGGMCSSGGVLYVAANGYYAVRPNGGPKACLPCQLQHGVATLRL